MSDYLAHFFFFQWGLSSFFSTVDKNSSAFSSTKLIFPIQCDTEKVYWFKLNMTLSLNKETKYFLKSIKTKRGWPKFWFPFHRIRAEEVKDISCLGNSHNAYRKQKQRKCKRFSKLTVERKTIMYKNYITKIRQENQLD